jgi:hypothetical protein
MRNSVLDADLTGAFIGTHPAGLHMRDHGIRGSIIKVTSATPLQRADRNKHKGKTCE